MSELLKAFPSFIYPINILDILIIAYAVYKLLEMIRGTRAVPLAKGVAVILASTVASEYLGLTTVNWVLVQLQTMFIIAIPVIFAPELRRVLEQLGTRSTKPFNRKTTGDEAVRAQVREIVSCMANASASRTGVLIAISRENMLMEYAQTGILIDGRLSASLLNNIFIVNTPLHDGAVIISDDRIVAASCFLPLSDNSHISMKLGTRHRAAIGLSEVSDAVVAVVSEETGAMSLAMDGHLNYNMSRDDLTEAMVKALYKEENVTFIDRARKVIGL